MIGLNIREIVVSFKVIFNLHEQTEKNYKKHSTNQQKFEIKICYLLNISLNIFQNTSQFLFQNGFTLYSPLGLH
jgi:hypothetical protein